MMEKLHSAAVTKHAAAAAALATFKKIEAQAKAVQALSKADKDLNGDELMKLLRWKLPSGSSKFKDKSARLAKWKEVVDLPDPPTPEVTEMHDLPWAAELGRMKARMEARAVAAAATAAGGAAATAAGGAAAAADPAPAATPAALAPRAAFDPDRATLEELDAQMELLESRKDRIQREASIAASAGTGSAAAAAMSAAAGVSQGEKRVAEPSLGGAPQSKAASWKSQRARVPKQAE
jgi:hypothetical protein